MPTPRTTAVRKGRTREPILTMSNIGKHFGAVKALTNVDFWVNEGEVVALIGDNGAGKSTLVKLLAGVHAPDAGRIQFDGVDVDIPSPADSHALGIATVFQDLALCDNLDVVENLWLGQELRNGLSLDEVEMEERTWMLLRELSAKLPSVRTPVASLSGGQRQTVAIARSLIGDPRVVILDEPTAALGVAQTAEVLNLIVRLRERGHGVVLISHNMADVMAVADRVVVLRLGRNNGIFNVADVTSETLIAAITGASLSPPMPATPHTDRTPATPDDTPPPEGIVSLVGRGRGRRGSTGGTR
ncbi:ATP-binding cassette domain-containing protein [Microbacterium sp. C7(2022)]|uniref:ATP-binding cassette domain-containing protein n=1 Tax=Microbacterium sp. C7(2022) TaxID=2992759 RepID=UPI00237A6F75|nr:ATP-binding cassette domain-containing protein [Microbacterium sp. C7(2022)]MDE0545850.1 ATP-binding cassette domain-containing protein [Microbacterium sp. C7(2022)]